MSHNTHTNLFLVQRGSDRVAVRSAESFVETEGMSKSQRQVAESINAELSDRLVHLAFGFVDADARVVQCELHTPPTITLPKFKPVSPRGARDAKNRVAAELKKVPGGKKVVGSACMRAVFNLVQNPRWTVADAADEAVDHFKRVLARSSK